MEFKYRIKCKPNDVIDRACALGQDKIMVSGDSNKGWFTGLFEGTYNIDGDEASIVITRKPIFLSWNLVDQGLRYLVN